MKDWIPLLQSLVWPLAVLVLAFRFRAPLARLAEAINSRVERGDSLDVGTSGIKLGASSPQTPSGPEPQPGAQPALDEPKATVKPGEVSGSGVHLVHTAHRERSLDRNGYRYYRFQVHLEADDDRDLDRVTKVVYHLHPTFYEPERTVVDRATKFALETAGWGMFALTADVYFEGRHEPVKLERYINF